MHGFLSEEGRLCRQLCTIARKLQRSYFLRSRQQSFRKYVIASLVVYTIINYMYYQDNGKGTDIQSDAGGRSWSSSTPCELMNRFRLAPALKTIVHQCAYICSHYKSDGSILRAGARLESLQSDNLSPFVNYWKFKKKQRFTHNRGSGRGIMISK